MNTIALSSQLQIAESQHGRLSIDQKQQKAAQSEEVGTVLYIVTLLTNTLVMKDEKKITRFDLTAVVGTIVSCNWTVVSW